MKKVGLAGILFVSILVLCVFLTASISAVSYNCVDPSFDQWTGYPIYLEQSPGGITYFTSTCEGSNVIEYFCPSRPPGSPPITNHQVFREPISGSDAIGMRVTGCSGEQSCFYRNEQSLIIPHPPIFPFCDDLYRCEDLDGAVYGEDNAVVIRDYSGNAYVVGNKNYSNPFAQGDIWVLKYDVNGNLLWNRTIDGGLGEIGYGAVLDSLSNLYLTGYSNSLVEGGYDIWTFKYDSNGNQIWNRTIGGRSDDYARAIALDSSNNFYVTGYTNSFGTGNNDIWTIKYSP